MVDDKTALENSNGNGNPRIILQPIEAEMKKSYLDYAMSVIVGRALPDVRDGLKPVHRRILYAMSEMGNTYNKPFKKAARIVGECFVKGTKIITEKGLIPIENIEKGNTVHTQNGKKKVKELFEMPEKELVKIKLSNGMSVIATPSQKLKMINDKLDFEWREAKDLSSSDFVVMKADYPIIKETVYLGKYDGRNIYLNENIAYLLGQLLSDGWIEKGIKRGYPFRIGFCSTSSGIISKINSILKEEFDYYCTIEEKQQHLEDNGKVLLVKKLYVIRINAGVINQLLVSKFSLYNAFAATKEIPEEIFKSPKKVIYSFMSGLIDGDGSVHIERNMIHYGSVSEKLIDQLQIILFHLGIMSQKYTNTKKTENKFAGRLIRSTRAFHYLEIGSIFAKKLANFLSLSEETKALRLKTIKECPAVKVSFFDAIPYAGEIIFGELSKKHIGGGWYEDNGGNKFKSGIKYPTGSKIRYSKDLKEKMLTKSQIVDWGIQRKLKDIDSALSSKVDHIIDGDIYFMNVQNTEKTKSEKTYDLEVEDDHEFVANGIVSHNCLGKYHPHGDIAVYDALIRMAQDFSLRYPLVQGQGNVGSVDGDSPAAMRYVEARMSKISDEVLQDIDKETVDFAPNFDGTLQEPLVLPSKFPNLLVNGSSGIAVGMATNIPPHNLKESCEAVIALIDNPYITIEELCSIIKGPDFPTAAEIIGRKGIIEAYKNGKGAIKIRSVIDIEQKKDRKRLIVKEIPYQINKSQLVEDIANLVKDKKISDISDLRDESDRDGVRIVIELKKDANPEIVKNLLYNYSRLEDSFGINFVALVDNQPRLLGLKPYLKNYLGHRIIIIRKRCMFDLKKAEERAHILEGLRIALKNIDAVVALIKASKSADDAKKSLIKNYSLTEVQSQAILDMRLQRIAALEQDKINNEYNDLLKLITELKDILASELKIRNIIKDELKYIIDKYSDLRKTKIIDVSDEELDFEIEDLIPNELVVITMTHSGYIKRMPLAAYKVQNRGGKGIIASDLKEGDFIENVFVAKTHSYLLTFTSAGKLYWVKVHKVPDASRQSLGKAIVNLLELGNDEKVNAIIPVNEFDDKHYLVMATRNGTIKKTNLIEFSNPRKGGILAINIDENDTLINVVMTDGTKNLLLATAKGQAAKFNEEDVRATGRNSSGVRGIRLDKSDAVIGMIIADDDRQILTLTENGFGKRTPIADYRLISRGGKGVRNILCSERNGKVVSVLSVNDVDEVMFISKKGILIRTECSQVSSVGRNTQGLRLIKLSPNDNAVSMTKIVKE